MQPMQMARDNRQALAGIVHCGLCESPMVRTGPNYTCPMSLERNPSHCNTTNAEALLRNVLDHVIQLVMTDRTVNSIVKDVQKESAEAALRHRQQLDQTERARDQLRSREAEIIDLADVGDGMDELDRIDDQSIALEYEARLSARELRALDFVMDDERLRANALNPETYRDPKYPGYTAQIIRTFIRSVDVTPEKITVKFMMPIPTAREPRGALQDTIPLP